MDRIMVTVPQFGNKDVHIVATDSQLAVSGFRSGSFRIPVSSRHGNFSNSDTDKADQQLLLEISGSRTDRLNMSITLIPNEPISDESLFICPSVIESAQISFVISSGVLTVKASRPMNGVNTDEFTMLTIPLQKEPSAV
ncbi:MAG TPA: hypothetical protein PLF31_00730 [Candidatus Paceibacterota bacterium]|nr:hypothetical protein [Candidatus Paceibacterota bacterium]